MTTQQNPCVEDNAPVEGLRDVATGLEGGHQLDHLEVGSLNNGIVLGLGEILLGAKDTLCAGRRAGNRGQERGQSGETRERARTEGEG